MWLAFDATWLKLRVQVGRSSESATLQATMSNLLSSTLTEVINLTCQAADQLVKSRFI